MVDFHIDGYHFTELSIGLFTFLFAVPVYLLFLYMIIRYRKLSQFNIPFYGLVFQCGLLDLFYLVYHYLFFNNFLINLVPQMFLWARVQVATVVYYGYFYIRPCQAMAVLVISINRFTAIVTPLRHELIWTRKITWLAILSQHLVAGLLLVPPLAGGCLTDYVLLNNDTGYTFSTLSNQCVSRLLGPAVLFMVILSFTLILLYSMMFLKVRQTGNNAGAGNQNPNDQRVQRGLALGGALISLTFVSTTIFVFISIFVIIQYSYFPPIFQVVKLILDTLFCIINPFVLLCFGYSVRPYYWKCVKKVFCVKENHPPQQNVNNQNVQPPIRQNFINGSHHASTAF